MLDVEAACYMSHNKMDPNAAEDQDQVQKVYLESQNQMIWATYKSQWWLQICGISVSLH